MSVKTQEHRSTLLLIFISEMQIFIAEMQIFITEMLSCIT
jgi:hypothetical protein